MHVRAHARTHICTQRTHMHAAHTHTSTDWFYITGTFLYPSTDCFDQTQLETRYWKCVSPSVKSSHLQSFVFLLTIAGDEDLTLQNANISWFSCLACMNGEMLHSFNTNRYYSDDPVIPRLKEDNSPVSVVELRSHSWVCQSHHNTQGGWLLSCHCICIYNMGKNSPWWVWLWELPKSLDL